MRLRALLPGARFEVIREVEVVQQVLELVHSLLELAHVLIAVGDCTAQHANEGVLHHEPQEAHDEANGVLSLVEGWQQPKTREQENVYGALQRRVIINGPL